MDTYLHNPTPVKAIQVTRPFRAVQKSVPFAREIKKGGGAFDFFLVSNVGSPADTHRAYEGDWIIRHTSGRYTTLSDKDFRTEYGVGDGAHSDEA